MKNTFLILFLFSVNLAFCQSNTGNLPVTKYDTVKAVFLLTPNDESQAVSKPGYIVGEAVTTNAKTTPITTQWVARKYLDANKVEFQKSTIFWQATRK